MDGGSAVAAFACGGLRSLSWIADLALLLLFVMIKKRVCWLDGTHNLNITLRINSNLLVFSSGEVVVVASPCFRSRCFCGGRRFSGTQ